MNLASVVEQLTVPWPNPLSREFADPSSAAVALAFLLVRPDAAFLAQLVEHQAKAERLRDEMSRAGARSVLDAAGSPSPEFVCAVGVVALSRLICGMPARTGDRHMRALCQLLFEEAAARAGPGFAALAAASRKRKLSRWAPYLRRAWLAPVEQRSWERKIQAALAWMIIGDALRSAGVTGDILFGQKKGE